VGPIQQAGSRLVRVHIYGAGVYQVTTVPSGLGGQGIFSRLLRERWSQAIRRPLTNTCYDAACKSGRMKTTGRQFPPRGSLLAAMLLVVLPGVEAQSLDVTGTWVGVLNQPGATFAPVVNWTSNLTQDANGAVTGTSSGVAPNQPQYFHFESVSGQVTNNAFTFQEGQFLSRNNPPGSYWCLISGQLSFSGSGGNAGTLSGSWQSASCRISGTLSLSRVGGPATGVPLRFVNPYGSFVNANAALSPVSASSVRDVSVAAHAMSADGVSAAVAVYTSSSSNAATFQVDSGSGLSLSVYSPDFLTSPPPPRGVFQVTVQPSFCDANGQNCVFLALLWPPSMVPVAVPGTGVTAPVERTVTVSQLVGSSQQSVQATITIYPPPLLLVHGIWSSAKEAGFSPLSANGLLSWISGRYPHDLIFAADYGDFSYKSFDDPAIQSALLFRIASAVASATARGVVARTVDVVGHSMGGLAARRLLSGGSIGTVPYLMPSPVHTMITIGTPHLGSNLATQLWLNQNRTGIIPPVGPQPVQDAALVIDALCALDALLGSSHCSLGSVLAFLGKKVDTGVQSLQPGSSQLSALSANQYGAIVGTAPPDTVVLGVPIPGSTTEALLDALITAYLPGQTVYSILNGAAEANDTIVPASSQSSGAADKATVSGIVHSAILCCDTGESASQNVWTQVLYWLQGGKGPLPGSAQSISEFQPMATAGTLAAAATQPILDLTGYQQVPASSASLTPASNSTLTINSAVNIRATSSKTITELLLLQSVSDPADVPVYYVRQSPFSISFTPTRLGTASFVAYVLFSDMTFAVTRLDYRLQPGGSPAALNLMDPPLGGLATGASVVVHAAASYTAGQVDVTQAANYQSRSGTSAVFRVNAGGGIAATGPGEDWLDVSYEGLTVSTPIVVGPCSYALGPLNQLVANTGGTVNIQVVTGAGCAWTASGGSSWLVLNRASVTGSGAITLSVPANTTGAVRTASVRVANQNVQVTQAATACSFSVAPTRISAPLSGMSGTLTVTTSCPVVASSNAPWVTLTGIGSVLSYTVATNYSASPRTATVTVGTVAIPLVQAGSPVVQAVSASPASGNGLSQTFTFKFSSAGGYQSLGVVDVLINNVLDGRRACYVAFVPSGANSGSVYLVNDAGDAGGPYSGMVLPGNGTVQNSQCSITGAGSVVAGSGNTLTLTLPLTFKTSFAGNKVLYLAARDVSSNNTDWQALGVWAVPGSVSSGPAVGGVSPARGANASQTYVFTFTDPRGWADIAVSNVLINSSLDGRHACYLAIVPTSSTRGTLYLVDDAGDAGGPYAEGSGSVVSNSQCAINAAASSLTASGTTLTLTLAMTFDHSFAGNKIIYMAVRSNTLNSGWQAMGTVSIP
jgi:hypothetical protein